MRKICIHFQVVQPHLLRTYRFCDINQNHNYFDDYQNRYLIHRLADRSFLPANQLLMELIKKYPDSLYLSMSISGSTIMLLKEYYPEALDSFKQLIATGNVEITGSTLTHSLASLNNKNTFLEQIKLQEEILKSTFGVKPTVFCNTELIYSDEIGEWLYEAGYQTVLTEGARHILGWKSPGYLYCNPYKTELNVLMRNPNLADDVTFRFNDSTWDQYPLSAEKMMQSIDRFPKDESLVNLFWDYDLLGLVQLEENGIFDFFKAFLSQLASSSNHQLCTPSAIIESKTTKSTIHVPWAISSSGEEKDLNEWLGNELQKEAFAQLFKLEELYNKSTCEYTKLAWLRLQNAFHYNFMSTKWLPHESVKRIFDVYPSPYQAFINYMNVVNDVKLQLEKTKK